MLKDKLNLKKTILITGASQGIGKACAIKFLKEGYLKYFKFELYKAKKPSKKLKDFNIL